MMPKQWLLCGCVGLALVVTPYLACSGRTDESVSVTEADLKQAALGTWQGSAELDGETIPFSLVLEQAVGKAKAQNAIFVNGTLTSENPALNGALDGQVQASSADAFSVALRLDDGKQLSGNLEKQSLSDGHIDSPARSGTFSFARP
jgi:hypothetical protein